MYLPRVFTRSLAWCLCGLAVSAMAPALADTYPGKPITLVVGYPPGGSTDLTGRALGVELSHRLGVPVIVDNVGGAGGVIGAQKVVNAAPDGYTLLVGANNEIAISRLVNASVRYEPKDFTPIGLIASQPLVLVAAPAAGVKNAGEFLALLKKSPGRYSYGSSGVGTSLHLAGEMVKQQGGVAMTHVPYRGVAPLTNDLLGGNIDFGVFALHSQRQDGGAGHHGGQALGHHARPAGAGRDAGTEEHRHRRVVCADGPCEDAGAGGGAPEKSAGRDAAVARLPPEDGGHQLGRPTGALGHRALPGR